MTPVAGAEDPLLGWATTDQRPVSVTRKQPPQRGARGKEVHSPRVPTQLIFRPAPP